MDAQIMWRAGSTLLMLVIFAGIVWWAYGRGRRARLDAAAISVLNDDDTPASMRANGRKK